MPRIRDAIRSGWKTSSWSSFSPTEANLIGLPVIALTESAAPPRASPSSFVSTTPSKAIRSWNASRDVHGLLAGHRVEDEQDVERLDGVADARELVHQRLVDVEPAGGVDDHDVEAVGLRALEALRAPPAPDPACRCGRRGSRSACRAARAGRSRPGAAGRRRRGPGSSPVLAQVERELGGGGRLARALQAGHQDHGRRPAEGELRVARAHQLRELVVDELDDLLARR